MARAGHDGAGATALVSNANVSIHVARAGHDVQPLATTSHGKVSIHVARAGHDVVNVGVVLISVSFNPRGPCGPRRLS